MAQSMKKLTLADPSLSDDQFVMEYGDMRSGPAEGNPANSPPEPYCLREAGMHRLVLQGRCQFYCNLLDIITSYCHKDC